MQRLCRWAFTPVLFLVLLALSSCADVDHERLLNSTTKVHTNDGRTGTSFHVGKGYHLTALHVVDKAKKVVVVTKDKQALTASVIKEIPQSDVAILATPIPRSKHQKLSLDCSLPVRGEKTTTVGFPFGMEYISSEGIVSSNVFDFPKGHQNQFALDMDIAVGVSGAAVVNDQTQVIGVITSILSDKKNGGITGYSLAASSVAFCDEIKKLKWSRYIDLNS